MAEALVIRNLSKRFGGLRAVQDVSFSVNENETARADRAERRGQDDELPPDHRLLSARRRFGHRFRPRDRRLAPA